MAEVSLVGSLTAARTRGVSQGRIGSALDEPPPRRRRLRHVVPLLILILAKGVEKLEGWPRRARASVPPRERQCARGERKR
jgi:hypothetical protein